MLHCFNYYYKPLIVTDWRTIPEEISLSGFAVVLNSRNHYEKLWLHIFVLFKTTGFSQKSNLNPLVLL